MAIKTEQAKRRLQAALKTNYAANRPTKNATVVAPGLISIEGRQFQAAVNGAVGEVVQVVNAGTASNALYVSSTGGAITGGGSSGNNGAIAAGAHSLSDTSIHLGQLNPNQAAWAFLSSGARAITGNVTVQDGFTIDGVDLDVHAADPDAHHPRATGGNSIAIGTDSQIVSVRLDSQSGLKHFDRSGVVGLRADLGFGLAFTTGLNTMRVDSVSDGKTYPNKVLQTDATGKVALTTLSADTITSTGNLAITPVGDIDLSPTGNDIFIGNYATISTKNWVSGFDNPGWGLGWNADTGRYFADFQDMTADTMHVLAFTADVSRVAVGERLVTYSSATLARDFLIPSNVGGATHIYVEDVPGFTDYQAFRTNDWLRVRIIDRSGGGLLVADAWGQVGFYVDQTGEDEGLQRWTFTFRYGTGGVWARAGLEVIDYGASLDGYIRDTVLDPAGAPYTEIATWITNPYDPNNKTIHLRLGNLDGLSGLERQWGLWAGQDSENYLLASDTNLIAAGMTLEMYDSGTKKIVIDPADPSIKVAQSSVDTFTPAAGNSGIFLGVDGSANKFYAGGASEYVLWDGSNLTVRGTLLLPDGNPPATGIVPRGAWSASAVSYAVNDVVDYGGNSYVCNTAHTTAGYTNLITNGDAEDSTTGWTNGGMTSFTSVSGGVTGNKFQAVDPDGSNNQVYQTVTVAASTAYTFAASMYSAAGSDIFVQLLDHTTPFANRGLNYTPHLGTSFAGFADHFTTTSDAADTTSRFRFYVTAAVSSGETYYFDDIELVESVRMTPDKSPYWNIYSQAGTGDTGTSFRFKSAWTSGVTYTKDASYIDIVYYGSQAWACTQSHTSAASGASGPPGTGSYWSLFAAKGADGAAGATGSTGATGPQGTSIRARGGWAAGQTYIKSADLIDWVTYNGSAYYALLTHTSAASGTNGPPGIGTRWNLMASKGDAGPPGQNNQDFSFISESMTSLPTNYSGLFVSSQRMGYVRNGTWRTYQDNSGNFYYGGSTGNHLFWNESAGRLGGANASGVTQWYASSSDGTLRAGGGSVILEQAGINAGGGKVRLGANGIQITSTSSTEGLRFVETFDGLVAASVNLRTILSPSKKYEWIHNMGGNKGTYIFNNGDMSISGGGLSALGTIAAQPTSTSSVAHGVSIYLPSGTTGNAINARYNNADRIQLRPRAVSNDVYVMPTDLGNNNPGSGVFIGRNTTTGAAGATPGFIGLMNANGAWVYLWSDKTGKIRQGTSRPTGSTASASVNSETAGTLI